MKKLITLFAATALVGATLTGCQTTTVEPPSAFDVTTAKTTYKVGETTQFDLAGGYVDNVIFYSGEPGRRYQNRERNLLAGMVKLVFQSSVQQGTLPSLDSLRIMVSTNLKGYDAASITGATWTDVTSRNTKWPTTLGTAYVTSDSVNLTDFNSAETLNIGFRFLGKNNAAQAQRKWNIQNLTLTNLLPDGTPTPLLSTFANTGWVEASIKNPANAWNVGTAGVSSANSLSNTSGVAIRSAYPITFDPGIATGVDDNDDWLIATAVNPKTVKPDVGAAIKSATNNTLSVYRYIFKTPGTYTVTFVAQNLNVDDKKEVVKQLTITVTP